ncbi:hypothetical protein [Kytococcus sedentarius]|uniref:hypothetical protein n=1 Tax=Kytococcus sedentarius TaxID=1276 RepID=UPI0035BC9315
MDDRTPQGASPLDATDGPQPTTPPHEHTGPQSSTWAPGQETPQQNALAPYPQGNPSHTGHLQAGSYPGQQPGQHFAGSSHQYPGQQGLAGPNGHAGPNGQMMATPKSPELAAVASFFIAGLGQLVNGDVARGLMFFCAMVGMGILSALLTFILLGWIMWPFMFATWLWNIFDAHKGAQKRNMRMGYVG